MKFISLATGVVMCALASNLHAFSLYQDNTCPAIDTIKAITFTQVSSPDENGPTVWTFLSDNFNYQDAAWNVYFVVDLPNATDADEAKAEANLYYKTNVEFHEPKVTVISDDMFFCEYALIDSVHAVFAFTPPLDNALQKKLF